jgi:hypothetical protein
MLVEWFGSSIQHVSHLFIRWRVCIEVNLTPYPRSYNTNICSICSEPWADLMIRLGDMLGTAMSDTERRNQVNIVFLNGRYYKPAWAYVEMLLNEAHLDNLSSSELESAFHSKSRLKT